MSKGAGWPKRFESFLVGSGPSADGEWKAWCPVHQDPEAGNTPAASFNFDKGVWHCFGGCPNMSINDAWYHVCFGEEPPPDNVVNISNHRERKNGNGKPLPTEEQISRWHEALVANSKALAIMAGERGLSEATLAQFQIGWDGERFTIPVRDLEGELRNVRRYLPHATRAQDKMFNWPGYGSPARLFLPQTLVDNDVVIITEGEMDALVGREHGLSTMSHTAGASVWRDDWTLEFRGKEVFLCYDVDDGGKSGARKAAAKLARVAESVFVINLDLPLKGSDLTDYFVKQGRSAKDFRKLMKLARQSPVQTKGRAPEPRQVAKPVTLEDSMSAELTGQPVELVVTIAGKQQPAYSIPRRIEYSCDMGAGKACTVCMMRARDGQHVETLEKYDPVLLQLLGVSIDKRNDVLREVAEAQRCNRLIIEVPESYSVEELLVAPSVEHRTEDVQTPLARRVFNVGHHATPINTTARIVGTSLPDPKDQRSILLAWDCEPVQTDLDRFTMNRDLVEALKVFQPAFNQTPLQKMAEIAEDLAANVTHIYGRPELHMAYDAVWHSVIDFYFQGSRIFKGWLELVVVGDTRTGKSEAALQLCRHYNAGILKSCEGATFAGLVGGVQQLGGKHWMTTWGVIPLNDRRLVVLDEFGGLYDRDIIEQMSSIRSSGKAQLTKIQTDETSARTRLIWLGNPIDGKALVELHMPGISALTALIRNPEDVARFDLAMAAASSDVSPSLINTTKHEKVPHIYTAELCQALVQWVWSRNAKDVRFRGGAERTIIEQAQILGSRYVPEPPLIQIENVRMKLARLSVAVAARTFSTDKKGRKVIIRPEHVISAVRLIDMLYGMRSFAYTLQSKRILGARKRATQAAVECRRFLDENRDDVVATLFAVRNNTGFKIQDFRIFGGMDDADAQAAVKTLMTMGMLRSMSHGKMKIEPALMEILQEIEDEED